MTLPKSLIVIARFHYHDPKTRKDFTVDQGWPCKSRQDAENIVKYHAHKTGAYQIQFNVEEAIYEEAEQPQTSTVTTQAYQA